MLQYLIDELMRISNEFMWQVILAKLTGLPASHAGVDLAGFP